MQIPEPVRDAMERLTPEQVVAYLRERADERMNALDGKPQASDAVLRAYSEDCAALLLAAEAVEREANDASDLLDLVMLAYLHCEISIGRAAEIVKRIGLSRKEFLGRFHSAYSGGQNYESELARQAEAFCAVLDAPTGAFPVSDWFARCRDEEQRLRTLVRAKGGQQG